MKPLLKKGLCLLFCLTICCFTLSCQKRNSAAQVALNYYILLTQQDASSLIDLGMPKELAQQTIDTIHISLSKQITKQLQLSEDTEIDPKLILQIKTAYLEALKQVSATVTEEKIPSGYTVFLSTTYIDYPAIEEEAIDLTLKDIDIDTYTNETQYISELITAYTKHLTDGYTNAKPSVDSVTLAYTFTLQEGLYMPEDYSDFIKQLFLVVTHQKTP